MRSCGWCEWFDCWCCSRCCCCSWRRQWILNQFDRRPYREPFFDIPTIRHFLSRHALHAVRFFLLITHSLLFLHSDIDDKLLYDRPKKDCREDREGKKRNWELKICRIFSCLLYKKCTVRRKFAFGIGKHGDSDAIRLASWGNYLPISFANKLDNWMHQSSLSFISLGRKFNLRMRCDGFKKGFLSRHRSLKACRNLSKLTTLSIQPKVVKSVKITKIKLKV